MRIDRIVVLEGGKLLTPMRIIEDGIVVVKESKILEVGEKEKVQIPSQSKRINVRDRYISPGFIDIHIHGGGGADVLDGRDALQTISQTHAQGGTTSMVPTVLTASSKRMLAAVRNIDEWQSKHTLGAQILGAHVEGPFFSMAQKGAQNPQYIRTPKKEEYSPFLEFSQTIRMMSLAPELEGALELGEMLTEKGIVPAIGHSDGTYKDVISAIEAGFSHVTHIFSGMSGVRRVKAFRIPGVIEATLLLDELTTEMIADGKHLPPSLIKLVIKSKGVDKVCLVTDATRPAGMPPGEYEVGGLKVIVEDGVAKLPDRKTFAGSVATMNMLVRNMVKLVGLSLGDAVKMATINPAKIIGLDKKKGVLAKEKDADIVVFDERMNIFLTMVGGVIVHQMRG